MCSRKIRETNNIPIIMLSAKSTDLDKILGLGTGKDCVVKLLNLLKLTAVSQVLKAPLSTQLNPNSGAREIRNNEITIKGMSINRDNHKVIVDGEEIKLTPIEFDILLSVSFQSTTICMFAFTSLACASVQMGMSGSVVQSVQYMLHEER